MSMFSNLTTENVEVAPQLSRTVESDIYEAKVKMAYAITSGSGAKGINLTLELNNNGSPFTLTQLIYVTNRNGENFYVPKNDSSKKYLLPGFRLINDLCTVSLGQELKDIVIEDKVIKVYDFDVKKEVNKEMPVLTTLLNCKLYVAVELRKENKRVKDSTGNYVPSSTIIERNELVEVMHNPTKMTVAEAKGKKESVYYQKWINKHKGEVFDRVKPAVVTGTTSTSHATSAEPVQSLFA